MMMMTILILLWFLLALVAACWCYLIIFKAFIHHHHHHHHDPTTYPVIGCMPSFYKNRRRLLDWYTDLLAAAPSQTITVSRLGARRTVVTANPENVEYMLKTNFVNYPKGKPFTDILGDLLGRGIFNVDGELWHSQRKLVSHEFTTRSLRDFLVKTMEAEAKERLLPILDAAAEDRKAVDMQDILRGFAFDIVCKVSLGADPGCLDPSSSPASGGGFARAFDVASGIIARRGAAPLPAIWKAKRALGIGTERQLRKEIEHIHESISDLIRIRKKEGDHDHGLGDQRSDFLSRLIAGGHDDEVIRDMAISLVMAGRDTTSSALTWFFWLLSSHPDVEASLLSEVMQADDEFGYESLKKMDLMRASLCESMRLFPPVAWDSKHAAGDDTLPDGTKIKRGDRVTYFPYGMGRMESVWGKDCRDFRPERWMSPEESVSQFKFPVFQAGPRTCLGKDMAFIQMKCVAAAVLRRYELRPVSGDTPIFVPLLTAHMSGGLKVLVRKRDQEEAM